MAPLRTVIRQSGWPKRRIFPDAFALVHTLLSAVLASWATTSEAKETNFVLWGRNFVFNVPPAFDMISKQKREDTGQWLTMKNSRVQHENGAWILVGKDVGLFQCDDSGDYQLKLMTSLFQKCLKSFPGSEFSVHLSSNKSCGASCAIYIVLFFKGKVDWSLVSGFEKDLTANQISGKN